MKKEPAFFKLANKEDIPDGKATRVLIPDGREIALFNLGGSIYALDNLCPHMGGPLAEGEIDGEAVTCPWHGWQFNIRTGSCENMPGEDATPFEIEIIQNEIFLKDY